MASVVDICNLALSHLGDSATVDAIDPPDGSLQAELCARYYPIALNSLLEIHTWNFSTFRQTLSLLTDEMDQWDYVYAWPNNAVDIFAVFDYESTDDYQEPTRDIDDHYFTYARYVPQPFHIEILSNGNRVICTNVENALARYSVLVTDSSKFSPLFVEALSWSLASKLAGPIIKGEEGRKEALRCLQMFDIISGKAKSCDSQKRDINLTNLHVVPWMNAR